MQLSSYKSLFPFCFFHQENEYFFIWLVLVNECVIRSETVLSLMLLQAKQGTPEPLAVVVVPGLLYFPVPTLLSLVTINKFYPTVRHC